MNIEREPKKKKPDVIKKRFGKIGNTVLATSMLSSVGAPAVASSEEDIPHQQTIELKSAEKEIDSAAYLREFIEQKEDEPLTFNEAVEVTPYIAGLFKKELPDTRLSKEQLQQETYILEGGITEDDREYLKKNGLALFQNKSTDFEDPPLFERLNEVYPDIKRGGEIKNTTLLGLYKVQTSKSRIYGGTIDNKVFMMLDSVNESDRLQFEKFSDKECTPLNPSIAFISALMHEYGHMDKEVEMDGAKIKFDEVKYDLPENVGEVFGNYGDEFSAGKSGFRLSLQKEGDNHPDYYIGLEEFVAQHIASKILTENNIPTLTVGLNGPQDSRNFEKILDKSGYSLPDLVKLHSDSDLEGFLIGVARSEEGGEERADKENFARGLELFAPLFQRKAYWEIPFRESFDVNLEGYGTEPIIKKRVFPGCDMPNVDSNYLATIK